MSDLSDATVRQPRSPAARNGIGKVGLVLLFIASFLIAQTLIGDGGLLDARQATRERQALAESITSLRHENARLREEARRLRDDPAAIAAIAREELGMIEPGEILVILGDPR